MHIYNGRISGDILAVDHLHLEGAGGALSTGVVAAITPAVHGAHQALPAQQGSIWGIDRY